MIYSFFPLNHTYFSVKLIINTFGICDIATVKLHFILNIFFIFVGIFSLFCLFYKVG